MENPRLEFEIEMNNKLSILQTYKDALENMVQIGGLWVVGQDKNIYHIEMPDKIHDTMWKHAKRYDIQTGKVMGYTHYDEIRAMSVEELALFIHNAEAQAIDTEIASTVEGWLDWLKQEAEDERTSRT